MPRLLTVGLLLGLLIASDMLAEWHDMSITLVSDFNEIGEKARRENLPILLMVSQDHCPFCVELKREVLNPMVISGEYDDQVVIVELLIDIGDKVIDFEGDSVDADSIATNYNIWVTPTLLFLDYRGKEVHKRMLGVNTIEMFGYYLDESLKDALKAVRQGEPYRYKTNEPDQLGSDPHREM